MIEAVGENRFALDINQNVIYLTVKSNEQKNRLDTYIANQAQPNISRSRVQQLIKQEKVTVNGHIVNKPSTKVSTDDLIVINIPPKQKMHLQPENITLDVIYENEDIILINKPRGMVIHPAAGHNSGTLVNALLGRWPQIEKVGEKTRPGIVHRLDKDTTGLLVVAKNEKILEHLKNQIKARKAKREYLALCKGRFGKKEGTIEIPIGRHPVNRKRMAALRPGIDVPPQYKVRKAITHWQVVSLFGSAYTLILAQLHTGRTHQLRVHLSYIGHPIVGDSVYGKNRNKLKLTGQALHAFKLGLYLKSKTGNVENYCEFKAPLPIDFAQTLMSLKNKYRKELPPWLLI